MLPPRFSNVVPSSLVSMVKLLTRCPKRINSNPHPNYSVWFRSVPRKGERGRSRAIVRSPNKFPFCHRSRSKPRSVHRSPLGARFGSRNLRLSARSVPRRCFIISQFRHAVNRILRQVATFVGRQVQNQRRRLGPRFQGTSGTSVRPSDCPRPRARTSPSL